MILIRLSIELIISHGKGEEFDIITHLRFCHFSILFIQWKRKASVSVWNYFLPKIPKGLMCPMEQPYELLRTFESMNSCPVNQLGMVVPSVINAETQLLWKQSYHRNQSWESCKKPVPISDSRQEARWVPSKESFLF